MTCPVHSSREEQSTARLSPTLATCRVLPPLSSRCSSADTHVAPEVVNPLFFDSMSVIKKALSEQIQHIKVLFIVAQLHVKFKEVQSSSKYNTVRAFLE